MGRGIRPYNEQTKEKIMNNYTFKVSKESDIDIQRICDEAPEDEIAIFILEDGGQQDENVLILIRERFLESVKKSNLASRYKWYTEVAYDDGTYKSVEEFKVSGIDRSEIGSFIAEVQATKKALEKKQNRKKIQVKVNFVQ
jgi:hypothetical protein